ncbi:MAG: YicC family protein [Ruminococcus sp.]|nr:YicC family protein [Ruminococcus sp.]
MTRSMTGYGRAQEIINGRDILVEIRSVNHRYYEYSSRIPRAYSYIDEKLKTLLKTNISRGKVEVSVTINSIESKESEISVNMAVADGYVKALRGVSEKLSLKDDLALSKLIKLPEIFVVQKVADNQEQLWADVVVVAESALSGFLEMRCTEGEKLRSDVISKADGILEMVGKIEEISPQTVENYRNRLYQKLMEILGTKDIDEQRILTESAIFAEKIAVDEETVRLRSHVSQLRDMFDSDEPVGRKLDFIVQEMNREVNTIGSKAQDLSVTKIVVEMKAEIEKIREQIQNIE